MKRLILKVTPFVLAGLVVLLLVVGCAQERSETSVYRILPNGLRIVAKENRASDVVAVQLWIRDGALFETPEEAGISNLLRGMMFGETETRELGEIERTVENLGGLVHSACRHDFTQYAAVAPADNFDTLIDILEDGLLNPIFDADRLSREKMRARRSISSMYGQPVEMAYLLCLGEIFGDHPYGHPCEGTEEGIQNVTIEQIEERYRERYVAANTLVVITGNLDPNLAASRVAHGLSGLPTGTLAEPAAPPVVWPTESSRVVERAQFKKAYQVIGFPGPGIEDRDNISMDVLLVILKEGRSSRLNMRLKEELGLVHSVSAGWYTQYHPSPLFVWMELPPENVEPAEQAVVDLFKEMAEEHVTDDELDKAKILLESYNLFLGETAEGQAFDRGYWHSIGGEEFAEEYVERLKAVTADEVKRAAELYLSPGIHVAAVVLPE